MPLDFIQLEFFVYGFIGTIYLRDWFPSLAINSILYYGFVWAGVHREDPEPNRFIFHVFPLIIIILGILVGLLFIYAFNTPRLFDVRIFRDRDNTNVNTKRTFAPETSLFILFALTITFGVYYVDGFFSDGNGTVSTSVALGVGWTLIAVGTILLIATLSWSLTTDNDHRNKRLDVKYLIPFSVLLATAAIYDFPHNAGFDTFHGLILIASLIIIYVLLYFYIGYVGMRSNGKNWTYSTFFSGNKVDTDRFKDSKHVFYFVIFSALIHISVMTIAYLVDIFTGSEVDPVVITLGVSSAFWVIILLIIIFVWEPRKHFIDLSSTKKSEGKRKENGKYSLLNANKKRNRKNINYSNRGSKDIQF